MSRKRTREVPIVNTTLVEIYEDLAHEDHEIRLKAAHKLVVEHIPNAEYDSIITVLKRLFRGLCSGRKAARLGFSIALTETLNHLKTGDRSFSNEDILNTLETTTIPETNTSGQDERDHFLGRLFGCDAVIKSGILFSQADLPSWQRLLDIICGISTRKPWLRQECGWILFGCIGNISEKVDQTVFAVRILEKLNQHKLIKTPEGVAIWIKVRSEFAHAKLPKSIWHQEDPLSAKEITTLAKVLKDAKTNLKEDGEPEIQGSATWSSQLHFVWDVVLSELFKSSSPIQHVEFDQFWKTAVDDGLFSASNSPERKHWGFLLFARVCSLAPLPEIYQCYSKNAVMCLIQSLKANDRYLRRSAQKVVQAICSRAKTEQASVPGMISGLLKACGMLDFDTAAKSKVVESLIDACEPAQATETISQLFQLLKTVQNVDETEAAQKVKNLLNIQLRIFNQLSNKAIQSNDTTELKPLATTLNGWIGLLHDDALSKSQNDKVTPSLPEKTISMIREKTQLAFEQSLKMGQSGRQLVLDAILTFQGSNTKSVSLANAEQAITELVNQGWKRFKDLTQSAYGSSASSNMVDRKTSRKQLEVHSQAVNKTTQPLQQESIQPGEGLALLYGLVLWQTYSDDTDAISVLQELFDLEERQAADRSEKKKKDQVGFSEADALIEIILSFASRPSKFLRKMTIDIFGSFTSQYTRDGLESLSSVLETKETASGQSELFEANDEGIADEEIDGEDESDVEMLDSDVEVEDDVAGGSSSDESGTGSETNSDDEKNDDQQDASLSALEASLASALGTRKLTTGDMNGVDESSSESDADMTDSEMIELDEKLANVFRARQADSGKKTEQKAAKANIVNFKNRVLDMIEIYFKQEYRNPNSLELVLPLLDLARSTNTKQLADKALELLRGLCSRCKGFANAPILHYESPAVNGNIKLVKSEARQRRKDELATSDDNDDESTASDEVVLMLQQVHNLASLPNTSNAHKSVCSQVSILIAKALFKAAVPVETVVGVYAATRVQQLTDPTCNINERFFIDWGNWCGSVKGKLGGTEELADNDNNNNTQGNTTKKEDPNGTSKKTKKKSDKPQDIDYPSDSDTEAPGVTPTSKTTKTKPKKKQPKQTESTKTNNEPPKSNGSIKPPVHHTEDTNKPTDSNEGRKKRRKRSSSTSTSTNNINMNTSGKDIGKENNNKKVIMNNGDDNRNSSISKSKSKVKKEKRSKMK